MDSIPLKKKECLLGYQRVLPSAGHLRLQLKCDHFFFSPLIQNETHTSPLPLATKKTMMKIHQSNKY